MKTVVHIIDGLGRGGTETLLADLLPHMSRHYRIVLVTVSSQNEFGDSIFQYCEKHYCLEHESPRHFFRSLRRLEKIIHRHQPALVRSQLVLSSVLARLATPKQTPLVVSIHNTLSSLIPRTLSGKLIKWIESNVRKNNVLLVGVTQAIVDDYRSFFSYRGPHRILYNYVREEFFELQPGRLETDGVLRVVAVGNLRPQKNYPFILDAFFKLKEVPVSLDIYGEGPLRAKLENQIKVQQLNVQLKGKTADVASILEQYDVFLMLSSFEGFGIAVAEAMAAYKPLILSDIEVLREITDSRAIFVSLDSADALANVFKQISKNPAGLNDMVLANRRKAEQDYSRAAYLRTLLEIYEQALNGKPSTKTKANSNPQTTL
ncbi:MAG: glycosyltransferase [Chitinophagaceae bacterium]